MQFSETLYHLLDINVDKYINPYLPHNQIRRLPKPVSHFLGYRSEPAKEPPTLIQWITTVFATVGGLCLVGGVYNYAPAVNKWNPPPMIASLGASAVLNYNAVRSPLAQPRNTIVGHTLSAVIGTAIAKAFQHDPNFFQSVGWVAGAIACAAASLAMSVTNTVHPPGGATAILACTQSQVIMLGWMFPPMILLASVLMVLVACIFNNIFRQYPTFWWTPEDVGRKLPKYRRREQSEAQEDDEEEGTLERDVEKGEMLSADAPSGELKISREFSDAVVKFVDGIDEVHIMPYKIQLPRHIEFSDEEVRLLQRLQARIREHSEVN